MELGHIDFFEQQKHLKKVSRTFALTIPLLPSPLDDYISNAYLLCRIADTVEDDPLASPEKKVQWLNEFSSFCRGGFSDEMELLRLHKVAMELVKAGAVENEYLLVKDMPNVVMRTVSYNNSIKKILSKGVSILSSGMADSIKGYSISTLEDVDKYCYYVAGVIGEVLALLFCEYNHSIDRKKLLSLSVSFGEGLQLTNILKDRYQDQKRNVSFLPAVAVEKQQEQIEEYSAICQGHLDDALSFILSIPAILGATLLELKDIGAEKITASVGVTYAVGMVAAAVVGYLCIRFMMKVVSHRKFRYFAYYCFAAGILAVVGHFVLIR